MKTLTTVLAATLLLLTSNLSLAANPPEFPGLEDFWALTGNTGGTAQEIQEQREQREEMEEFARNLRAWWEAENPKPMPYLKYKGKKLKVPAKFLKAYETAKKGNKLKIAWGKIEKDLKSADFVK